MLKRFLVTLGILAGLLSPVYAAGTIPGISMTQQLDASAKPLSGGLLYLIHAGTTSTPQNCYQDTDLTIPWPNPVTLDAAGRVPQLICADGSIKVRLTDKNGVQQLVQDNILIIGASSGSGGGGSVDATTILATGDLKVKYGTGSLSGFVRANGRTIGSATSGATERANADTQSLFEYLWGADANLTVSGGRGASANADWVANKTIALPDARGRSLAALADMGNTDVGLYSGATFTKGNATTLGSQIGAPLSTLVRSDLPNVAPSFAGNGATISVATTISSVLNGSISSTNQGIQSGGSFNVTLLQAAAVNSSTIVSTGSYTPTGNVQSLNGGVTQTSVQTSSPLFFVTTYIKL